MVKVSGAPVHVTDALVYEGVTVTVAVTGVVPLLTAVKAAIFPVPLAARPTDVVLFVQLKTVPATALVKLTAVVVAPAQTDWLVTAFTDGVGFAVMVNVIGV